MADTLHADVRGITSVLVGCCYKTDALLVVGLRLATRTSFAGDIARLTAEKAMQLKRRGKESHHRQGRWVEGKVKR